MSAETDVPNDQILPSADGPPTPDGSTEVFELLRRLCRRPRFGESPHGTVGGARSDAGQVDRGSRDGLPIVYLSRPCGARVLPALSMYLNLARPGRVPHAYHQVEAAPTTARPGDEIEIVRRVLSDLAAELGAGRNSRYGRIRFQRFELVDWLLGQSLEAIDDAPDRVLRTRLAARVGAAADGFWFRAVVSGRLPLVGSRYRWFLTQPYLSPRDPGTFLGFAERLTVGARTAEDPAQVLRLMVHAFLEDLRQAYRRLSWLARGARRTTYAVALLDDAEADNGGHRLLQLVADVRNETGMFDPLLLVAAGRSLPPVNGPHGALDEAWPAEQALDAYRDWRATLAAASTPGSQVAWYLPFRATSPSVPRPRASSTPASDGTDLANATTAEMPVVTGTTPTVAVAGHPSTAATGAGGPSFDSDVTATLPQQSTPQSQTGLPSQSGAPSQSDVPAQAGAPSQAGVPAQAGAPSQAGVPSQAGAPSQAGVPSQATSTHQPALAQAASSPQAEATQQATSPLAVSSLAASAQTGSGQAGSGQAAESTDTSASTRQATLVQQTTSPQQAALPQQATPETRRRRATVGPVTIERPPWWSRRSVLVALVVVGVAALALPAVYVANRYRSDHCGHRAFWNNIGSLHAATGPDGETECVGLSDGSYPFGATSGRLAAVQRRIYQQNLRVTSECGRTTRRCVKLAYLADFNSTNAVSAREGLVGAAAMQARQLRPGDGPLFEIVIADAGRQMRHGPDAARQLVELARRDAAAGGRNLVGVIGLDQTRKSTARTIDILTDAGLPLVAATPAVDASAITSPAYFQVPPSAPREAAAVARYARWSLEEERPDLANNREVRIVESDDDYSRALADAAERAFTDPEIGYRVEPSARRRAAAVRTTPSQQATESADPYQSAQHACTFTGVTFFAGRSEDFREFLDGVNDTCKNNARTQPLIVAGSDVARFVGDRDERKRFPSIRYDYVSFAVGRDPCAARDDLYDVVEALAPKACSARGGAESGVSLNGDATFEDYAMLTYDATNMVVSAVRAAGDRFPNAALVMDRLADISGAGALDGYTGLVDLERAQGAGGKGAVDKALAIVRIPESLASPADAKPSKPEVKALCGTIRGVETATWCPSDRPGHA